MLCSRCSGITRSSPTPTNRSIPPTSPTAATPSSKLSSPTSSTDPWPTCRQDVSARTRRGSCALRSPTTCCAPPVSWPAVPTRWPAEPPCAARSSPSRPGWSGRNADRSCTYPRTGPGHSSGSPCGATPSATAHHCQQLPDHSPNRPNNRPQEKLGRPAATGCPQPRTRQQSVPRHLNRIDPRIEV